MCDCYSHKCDNPKCDTHLPMHIADFCTPRGNVEVFCTRHIPKNFAGRIYRLTHGEDGLPRGYKIGIRIKDVSKVVGYDDGEIATPNLCAYEEVVAYSSSK